MANHNYWLVLGPILIVIALGVWVVLTYWASRRQGREKPGEPVEPPPRGDVSGGIIRGTSSTETRWDEAVRRDHRPDREPPAGDERER
jgi:hypothetical protein